MLWVLISLFFFYLIYRELSNPLLELSEFSTFDVGYVVVLLLLAFAFAWPPVSNWRFERRLSEIAGVLAERADVSVHCNSAFDAIFDSEINVAGHANPETGEIVLQYSWCGKLIDYLEQPENASDELSWSMSLFVHEAMHARGEYVESKTECQAIQRRVHAERLFGVPEPIAAKNATHYYENLYWRRHPYFAVECVSGGALDERLAYWNWPTGGNTK